MFRFFLAWLIGFIGIRYYILKDYYFYYNADRLDKKRARRGGTAIITGASRGIGFETLKELLKYEWHVIAAVRNVDVAANLLKPVLEEGMKGTIDIMRLDVASMASVKQFSEQIKKKYNKIDLLVNNAGILYGDFQLTEDGYERQFATNYVGHFYLSHLMMDLLQNAGKNNIHIARIVNVASCAHVLDGLNFDDMDMTKNYYEYVAYARSKLAQVMFSYYINNLFASRNIPVQCFSVHPGIVQSGMAEDLKKLNNIDFFLKRGMLRTSKHGSVSVVYTCLAPELNKMGGDYIDNCDVGFSSFYSRNSELQKKLFKWTCDSLKIENFGNL